MADPSEYPSTTGVGVLIDDGSAPAGTTSRFPASAGHAFDPAGSLADQSVRPVAWASAYTRPA